MRRHFLTVAGILLIAGCASAPPMTYVPSVTTAARPAVAKDKVELFYGENNAPFPYTELGRIFLSVTPDKLENPAGQIDMIRQRAAELGADGVILVPSKATFGQGYVSGSRRYATGNSYEYKGDIYSGVVIIKRAMPAKGKGDQPHE